MQPCNEAIDRGYSPPINRTAIRFRLECIWQQSSIMTPVGKRRPPGGLEFGSARWVASGRKRVNVHAEKGPCYERCCFGNALHTLRICSQPCTPYTTTETSVKLISPESRKDVTTLPRTTSPHVCLRPVVSFRVVPYPLCRANI
jgi:hypothetical protein